MKTTVRLKTEIEIAAVKIRVAVRYDEEDIPNDFPLRRGDVWEAVVNIDTGHINFWPKGKSANLYMKVCDEGDYTLLDKGGEAIASLEGDYVPHG